MVQPTAPVRGYGISLGGSPVYGVGSTCNPGGLTMDSQKTPVRVKKSDFSRRTVVRGAAWTVPAVAIGVAAPAFAASTTPPPPVINFGGACGNTGSTGKGCGGDKTLQVPLTLNNPGATDIVFQITSMFTCN